MDAWETLIAGSTIPSGDAWEHLQAQGRGTGGDITIILASGLYGRLNESALSGDVEEATMLASLSDTVLAGDMEEAGIAAAITVQQLSGAITAPVLEGYING